MPSCNSPFSHGRRKAKRASISSGNAGARIVSIPGDTKTSQFSVGKTEWVDKPTRYTSTFREGMDF